MISPNTDFPPTRFWFRDKKIHIYISAIPCSSAIFLCLFIVWSQNSQTVQFRLTRFYSGSKMLVRRGPSIAYLLHIYYHNLPKSEFIFNIFCSFTHIYLPECLPKSEFIFIYIFGFSCLYLHTNYVMVFYELL